MVRFPRIPRTWWSAVSASPRPGRPSDNEPPSVELHDRSILLRTGAASLDFGPAVVFAANGTAGQAPEHGDLAHVRQRIGDRALKQLLRRRAELRARG